MLCLHPGAGSRSGMKVANQKAEDPMLTLTLLSLVLIPIALDLGMRRGRATIKLSMVRQSK